MKERDYERELLNSTRIRSTDESSWYVVLIVIAVAVAVLAVKFIGAIWF